VLYETENNPLVKLAWNKLDSNYLAVIEMDEKFVTLLDTRYIMSTLLGNPNSLSQN
jgi:WD repeat-containing protein 68